MMTQSARLYSAVQIAYVLCYCHEYTFSIDISLATTQELPELLILFP